jgi:hypothetical protein
MTRGIENKVVVIIGASSGLGKPRRVVSRKMTPKSCSAPGGSTAVSDAAQPSTWPAKSAPLV